MTDADGRMKRLIGEYVRAKQSNHTDLTDSLVETALYIEDAFQIVLSDAEICQECLGTPETPILTHIPDQQPKVH